MAREQARLAWLARTMPVSSRFTVPSHSYH
jgi:hypothetical protein